MLLKLSQAARRDLAQIYRHSVRQFGTKQANSYRDGLLGALDFIAEHPYAMREHIGYKRAIRYHPHLSHLIVFAIENDIVVIVRVVHGHQDLANLL